MFLTIYHFIVKCSVSNVISIMWGLKFRMELGVPKQTAIVSCGYRRYRARTRHNDRLYDLQRLSLRSTIVGLTASTTITQSDLLTPHEGYLLLILCRGTEVHRCRLFCCALLMVFHVFGLYCSHSMTIS